MDFDTHAAIKELKASGMPEAQAEAVSAIILLSRQRGFEHLATKLDVEEVRKEIEILRGETKVDIEVLRRDMEQMKADIIKWVAGMLVAQAAVVATLVKLL